jgi:hypothetical protein
MGGYKNIKPEEGKLLPKGQKHPGQGKRGPAKVKILDRMKNLIYGEQETFKILNAELLDKRGRGTGKFADVRVKLLRADQLALHGINLIKQHRDMFKDFLDRDSGKAVETIKMGNVDNEDGEDSGFNVILKTVLVLITLIPF